MREDIKDKGHLEHMLQTCYTLLKYKDKYDYEDAIANPIIFFGFVKLMENIGEASYMLTTEFKTTHPQLPWSDIVGMRHSLIRGYDTIQPTDLWEAVQNGIPALRLLIEDLLDDAGLAEE